PSPAADYQLHHLHQQWSRSPLVGGVRGRPTIEDAIAQEQYHLSVLQNSTYGDLGRGDGDWLNLTGLEPETGFAWDGLGAVKEKVGQHLFHAVGEEGTVALDGAGTVSLPLWHNVTGFVHGKWARSKLEETLPRPQLNMSSYSTTGAFGQTVERHFDGNLTGQAGDMSVRLRARPQHQYQGADETAMNVTGISAEMSISHDDYEVEVQVYGTYFMDIGQAIMTTTSDKFAGIFALPHMALSAHTFNASRTLLNESISRTIKLQKDGEIDHLNPWSSHKSPNEPVIQPLHCELIVYLQQLPPSGLPATRATAPLLSSVETELRFPSGAILPAVPDLRFSMLAFSPDCGYVLESKGEPDFVPQEGTHLTGPKIEVLTRNSRHHLIFFALTIGAQLHLLIRQMREASTPSTRSRISYYTIALLALGDGFAAICFVMLSIFIPDVWANLCTAAFLALISVSFFGMRFILDIWTTQAPEREAVARAEAEDERQRLERLRAALQRIRADREANRARMAAAPDGPPSATTAPPDQAQNDSPQQTTNTNAAGAPELQSHPSQVSMPDSLPLATTPQAPAAPTDTGATPVFFMPSDQAGLQLTLDPGLPTTNIPTTGPINVEPRMPTFAALYIKFYVLLLLVLFITSSAISWPAILQKGYFVTLALLYLSPWWPQIYRNAWRNCRHALELEFVLGQSALRLVPFAYFFAYPHNIIFASRDLIALAVLGGWVWIQACVLVSQEILGPRWFVKGSWMPEAYDYHPVLREDEEAGSTMPIGFSEASATSAPSSPSLERRGSTFKDAKEKGKGKRVFDCAICMQDLEVPVIEAGQSGAGEGGLGGGLLGRRGYMVTPCRHIFHTGCLEGWMKYRLQCPICREGLPAFTASSRLPEPPTEDPLDSSLHLLAEAVAALRSAGPHYRFLCEEIWVFVAGSWERAQWETAIGEARRRMGGVGGGKDRVGDVRRALVFAGERLGEAVGVLEADERYLRDAGDLVGCLGGLLGVGWEGGVGFW
ncbi:RING-H2 zinc finger protein domain, partial [Teratosphaeria destructans]